MATDLKTNLLKLQANMLNFAMLLTSNRDDAYDLLQDTTLRVLDNADKYSSSDSFKGWVFTIMRNIFINNYRRTLRSGVVTADSDTLLALNLQATQAGLDTPEGSVAAAELHDAIGNLPEEYRTPLSMHIAGYQYDEIAARISLPVGTVKSRIYHARRRLQSRLCDAR